MIVVPTISSTDIVGGETEIVDTVAETTPEVNTTVAVLVIAILSVVSVAETVLVSALVDFITAVTCPLALVGDAGWVMVLLVPVEATVTALPETGLPN